jgi:hypothetical protein
MNALSCGVQVQGHRLLQVLLFLLQAYLLADHLCFAPETAPPGAADVAGVTKCVPLERIPVRGRPRGYSPSPGIAPVDPR